MVGGPGTRSGNRRSSGSNAQGRCGEQAEALGLSSVSGEGDARGRRLQERMALVMVMSPGAPFLIQFPKDDLPQAHIRPILGKTLGKHK